MDEIAKQNFEEWQKFANDDLETAELLLKEDGPINPVCFHSQQAAEKYLKAYLVLNDRRLEKTHDLGSLLNLCTKIDISFEQLLKNILYLSEFYTETRYPGDIPEFNFDHASKAFDHAKIVKEFVLSKFK
ncbi:MAG: HEPN domain-containing protein [Patescibacteria group bacterium]